MSSKRKKKLTAFDGWLYLHLMRLNLSLIDTWFIFWVWNNNFFLCWWVYWWSLMFNWVSLSFVLFYIDFLSSEGQIHCLLIVCLIYCWQLNFPFVILLQFFCFCEKCFLFLNKQLKEKKWNFFKFERWPDLSNFFNFFFFSTLKSILPLASFN